MRYAGCSGMWSADETSIDVGERFCTASLFINRNLSMRRINPLGEAEVTCYQAISGISIIHNQWFSIALYSAAHIR